MHPELRFHYMSRGSNQQQQQQSSVQSITTVTDIQDQTEFTNICSLCDTRIDTVNDLRDHLSKVHQWSVEQIESWLPSGLVEIEDSNAQLHNANNTSVNDLEVDNEPSLEPIVPTIIVTCTPDQVLASVVESGINSSSADHKDVKSIEAIFMLPNSGAGGLSVMVDPKILESDALLQSLQTALEQNTTMKAIATKAYQAMHATDGNFGQLTQSQVEENGSQTCKTFNNELIEGSSVTQTTCNLPEFSTIDATVLQSETQ